MKIKLLLIVILLCVLGVKLFLDKKDDSFNEYPEVMDKSKVGTYPAHVNSGAGYFYDEVLEYRVWIHPERGGKDVNGGNDYFRAFDNYADALKFSKSTRGSEIPLALVLQKESIDEPTPGQFLHVTDERITEWRIEWLEGNKRNDNSISNFLRENSK